jgi:hypothetical protein
LADGLLCGHQLTIDVGQLDVVGICDPQMPHADSREAIGDLTTHASEAGDRNFQLSDSLLADLAIHPELVSGGSLEVGAAIKFGWVMGRSGLKFVTGWDGL